MPRFAFFIEVDPVQLGMLQSLSGILNGILENAQMVEVPDDWNDDNTTDTTQPEPPSEETDWEGEGGAVPLDLTDPDVVITPENDPTAPENLGIDLGDRRPDQITPFYPQSEAADFGAGEPPANA